MKISKGDLLIRRASLFRKNEDYYEVIEVNNDKIKMINHHDSHFVSFDVMVQIDYHNINHFNMWIKSSNTINHKLTNIFN